MVTMKRFLPLIACLFLVACGGSKTSSADQKAQPDGFEGSSCAVCGMVVDEQPPPRGQVRHRDGSHRFTCSLGDLRAYVQAPNPLGDPTDIWVEDLGAGWQPDDSSYGARPWIAASDASYVVGLERPRVMGLPVASFKEPSAAEAMSKGEGRKVVTWAQLKATPFSEAP